MGTLRRVVVVLLGAAHIQAVSAAAILTILDGKPAGISADGRVVVGYAGGSDYPQAVRWVDGQKQFLGDLPGGWVPRSEALAVSADGSVVVGWGTSAQGVEAFRWTKGDMQPLGDLPGGAFGSQAVAVSGDGRIVVGWGRSAQGVKAFRWTKDDIQPLGDLPSGGQASVAHGVSSDGSVVVGMSESANGIEATRWTGSVIQPLGDLPGGGFNSQALAVSADGRVVVGYGNSAMGTEAFRWTESGMEPLGDLPGGDFYSEAVAVSADGRVVVGYSGSSSSLYYEPFIWDPRHRMRPLQSVLTTDYGLDFGDVQFTTADGLGSWDFHLTGVSGISADGRTIVGDGIFTGGALAGTGWMVQLDGVVTLPPKPPGDASLLLFSGQNTSAPLTVDNFDSSLPTILVTHGWQPGEDQSFGDGNLPRQDTINAILTRLDGLSIDANVVLYNWEGAYTTVAKESYQATSNAGVNLGNQLSKILGSDYEKSFHMIGHSHGTGVNGFAVDLLQKQGISVDLFTVLDSPMDVTSGIFTNADFPRDFFAATLDGDAVGHVENYTGDGPLAYGTFIQGAGNKRLPGDHSGVPEIYGSEIVALDKIKRLFLDEEWPWLTPSRNNIEASSLFEWKGAELQITKANFKDWLTLKGVSYDVTCEELGAEKGCSYSDVYRTLVESSPSAVSTELVIPNDVTTFMFDYVFGNTGDGDWISLYFEDELLWELSGLSMTAGWVGTAFVDVRGFGGRTGTLTFLLNSVGESNLEFAFANLRYLNHSGSVPLPSTVALFMLGVPILVRHRRTYRHRK